MSPYFQLGLVMLLIFLAVYMAYYVVWVTIAVFKAKEPLRFPPKNTWA
jgi:hypothetical protein